MAHDIRDAAFGLGSERRSRTRRLDKHGIHHGPVGKGLLIQNFNLPASRAKIAGYNRLVLCDAACGGKKPLLKTLRSGDFLIQIAQKLTVQSSRMTKIDAHPFRGSSLVLAMNAKRF